MKEKIDKVIGKKGILRAPAFFINELFNDIIKYINNIK